MKRIIAIVFAAVLLLSACGPAAPTNPNIILATTTSTQDSGLLDVLVPLFQEQTGYVVQTVAVGSGQAMEMGQQCNADVLLVHSPSAEKAFMDEGAGKERELVMHNDFIIVGPASDPAGIKGMGSGSFKARAAEAPCRPCRQVRYQHKNSASRRLN
jgi:tungstate transport system substrate-binding protein